MTVQSVNRAIDILRTIAAHPNGVGLSDLARQTDLHKSTVFRLVSTLEQANVVRRSPSNQQFLVDGNFASLFAVPTGPQQLIDAARPYLQELCAASSEDAGLALPDGDCVVYADQVMSGHALQVRDWTGLRFPLHEVSAGRIMLAYRNSAEIAAFQQQWTRQETFVDIPTLIAQLPTMRTQRHAWIFNPKTTGLNAVAAPVFDQDSAVIAALCIFGPDTRFPKPGQRDTITELVVDASERLTARLAFRPKSPPHTGE